MKLYLLLITSGACTAGEDRDVWFGRVNRAIQVGVDEFVAPEREVQRSALGRARHETQIGLLRFGLTVPAAIAWAASPRKGPVPPPAPPARFGAARSAFNWISDNVVHHIVPESVDRQIFTAATGWEFIDHEPIGDDYDFADREPMVDQEELEDMYGFFF